MAFITRKSSFLIKHGIILWTKWDFPFKQLELPHKMGLPYEQQVIITGFPVTSNKQYDFPISKNDFRIT